MDLLIKHEAFAGRGLAVRDRKSTRLNSSHSQISYAVFCLKKKKTDMLDTLAPLDNKYRISQARSSSRLRVPPMCMTTRLWQCSIVVSRPCTVAKFQRPVAT